MMGLARGLAVNLLLEVLAPRRVWKSVEIEGNAKSKTLLLMKRSILAADVEASFSLKPIGADWNRPFLSP
jgi:hypothetical protein